MHDLLRHCHRSVAPQKMPGVSAASIGRRAVRVVWQCCATVLIGVSLLGAAPAVREFAISIRDRRVEGVESTIRVERGSTVVLRWRTDERVSVHVHGYDIEATLSPGASNVMRIQAVVAGRFPITAHQFGTAVGTESHSKKHREVTLLYLEILPE